MDAATARKPSLLPNLNAFGNVTAQIGPAIMIDNGVIADNVVTPQVRTTKFTSTGGGGGSERQLGGLKPIMPLRKRGQSFRETKMITTSVDAEGRRHLNQ